MSYFLAPALVTLRNQINAEFPARSKASDGWVGDQAHQSRASDHNPDSTGMVCALDITHDPAHGVDIDKLTDILYANRDHRIKYLIANRLITSPSGTGTGNYGGWIHYSGSNPHTKHFHISVLGGNYGNGTASWSGFGAAPQPTPPVPNSPGYPLTGGQVFGRWNEPGTRSDGVPWARLTRSGDDRWDHEPIQTWIRSIQERLNAHYLGAGGSPALVVDGYFGTATNGVTKWFQGARGLSVDGMVGPATWAQLFLGAAARGRVSGDARRMPEAVDEPDRLWAHQWCDDGVPVEDPA